MVGPTRASPRALDLAVKNFRISWFIGGLVVVILLVGLFFDIWRSYAVRKSLEIDVRTITQDCAKFLPFRPREAVEYGIAALNQRGIPADPGSVTVAADGYSVRVSVISDVAAYFAWIVGSPRLKFAAQSEAEVVLAGAGPVESVPSAEVALVIGRYKDFKLRNLVALSPSGDSSVPDYALKAWRLASTGGEIRVGDSVTLAPLRDFQHLKDYASSAPLTVAIVTGLEGERATVQGFGALSFEGLNADGQVTGRFIRAQAQGAPNVFLPSEHDFGYVRGGTPRITLK